MVTFTKEDRRVILKHILTKVMDCDMEGRFPELVEAMTHQSWNGPSDFFAMTFSNIENLDYWKKPESKGQPKVLVKISEALQHYLKWFVQWLNLVVAPRYGSRDLTMDQYLELTKVEFDAYRSNLQIHLEGTMKIEPPTTMSSNVKTPPDPGVTATKKTLLDEYKRNVKRDPKLYPVLKNHLYFDTWNTEVICQATEHDVLDVLDITYKPNTSEEKELFERKQKFMTKVFLNIMVSPASR
jgi:hypothetical protein